MARELNIDDETMEAIEPFLTVYSTSRETWTDAEGQSYVRLPLNRLSALDIVKVLRRAYPATEDEVVAQFAANVVDRRDLDSVPTRLKVSGQQRPRFWATSRGR